MKLVILISLAAVAAAGTFGEESRPYHAAEPFTSGLKAKIKTWADRFPGLKNLISAQSATLPPALQQVTGNGYTHYSQSAAMQAVEGVDASSFDSFTSYLAKSLEIGGDKLDGFLGSMELIKYADNTDWSLVDIIFNQQDGANCKYVCILGHRDLAQNTYDFMIADFKSSFKLAPNIVIIEERKSALWGLIQRVNIRVERIPASLKLQDVELLKSFFSQAALARFAKMLDVRVPGYEEAFIDPMTAIGLISAGLDIVPKIMNLFRTTSTSSIIKEIAGEGFSRYEQTSQAQVIQGMAMDNVLDKLVPMLPKLMKVSDTVMEGVVAAVQLGVLTDSYTWNDYKICFNQDKSGSNRVQFADVVVNNRGDMKYNLILVSVTQGFALAPNIQYIQNEKSYVGGIYAETKIERKEYPRSLTEKDMEVLMAFFHISVFKRLATMYGVPVPQLPEKPPLKP